MKGLSQAVPSIGGALSVLGVLLNLTAPVVADVNVVPTSPGFHTDFQALVTEAMQAGYAVPAVTGAGGASAWGDVALMEMQVTPDNSYYAVTALQPFPLVGLDPEGYPYAPPASYDAKLGVHVTWVHEKAHRLFLAGFDPWCTQNPQACADYKDCYQVAWNPEDDDINDPCSEEYALQHEGQALADECARLCAEEGLSPEELAERLATLNERIDDVHEQWDTAQGICEFCAWHGVPLPADLGQTTPPTQCECAS